MAEPDRVRREDLQRRPNPFQRIGGHFQSKTVSGLLELLPILVPIVIILYIAGKANDAIIPFIQTAIREFSGRAWEFPAIPGAGLVLAIAVFYMVGLLTSTKIGKAAMSGLTDVMGRIPVVKGILGLTRQATTVMTSQFNFSRVVFLEWPREGMIALGFVTARVVKPGSEESLAIVYIPTVPNPTSGNMSLVSEDDLFETDLSVEDAMKLVFSGGIVPPDAISLGRMPIECRVDSNLVGRFETDR